jgi:hypothetical protein
MGSEEKEPKPGRIKETGPFREWVFPVEEIEQQVKQLLQDIGYELQSKSHIGFVQPDFYAKRREGEKSYPIVGLVRQNLDEAVDGYAKLAAMKTILGKDIDYVLALPPMNEYLLLEFLTGDKGRWFNEIQRQRFMMWLCNPDHDLIWCILGGTRDKHLEKYFAPVTISLAPVIMMRLSREEQEEMMEEEEF